MPHRLDVGLEQLRRARIDVAIVALTLPDCWGLEGVERIRVHAGLPVVVLASMVQERLAMKALQCGAVDYLLKGHMDGNLLGAA